ncbi:MutS-related protein [Sphingobacterium faecium]|uniref:MutS-related protein n=1 Tax=Sphingobacterium faecium TaxID=34087 RepID=UPI001FD2EA4B|nr:DNA mismatch repair protein MutS [Sphingobacterium faecium]
MMDIYLSNKVQIEQEVKKLDRAINQNSFYRLGVIIFGGAALFYSFQLENLLLVLILFFGLIFLFAFLVSRQSKLEKISAYQKALLAVNLNEIDLENKGVNIYDNGASLEDNKHPYSADLDIVGSHSLFELLNRSTTKLSLSVLGEWLLTDAKRGEILKRQEAAAELATDITWSQDFQAKLLSNLNQKLDVKSFLSTYFQSADFSFGHSFMRLYVKLAPFLFIGAVILAVFIPAAAYIPLVIGLAHVFWSMANGGKVAFFSSRIDKVGNLLDSYAASMELVENRIWKATRNQELQEQLKIQGSSDSVSHAFKKLGKLISNLDARNNMMVGTILNLIFLWDFKQVFAIVDWKAKYQVNILESFDTLAEVEALVSLGTWKRNHADWATPIIVEHLDTALEAVDLAHPLIAIDKAVANTYTNADHQIALVTGSNMAGKSTFLRTVGINAVLAYAGAVVPATSFKLPIFHLISYMRIKDNLNESTSTFKAELDRMKFILETVAQRADSFFLIDEMLRGTNSVDKYLGSRAIIKKLITENGKGMVATHDLQLSTLADEYPKVVKNYHFDIQVIQDEMLFDYKLKIGECKIFNASMLLKGIGVDVEQGRN